MVSMKRSWTVPVLAVLGVGCAAQEVVDQTGDPCQAIVAQMSACYPDLATEAVCTPETLSEYDRLGLAGKECGDLKTAGKADLVSFDGCDAGYHVCNWLFCCGDYHITWQPKSESDWSITSAVDAFQAQVPADAAADFAAATWDDLSEVMSRSWVQKVAEVSSKPAVEMAVELTKGVVPLRYGTFVTRLKAQDWGIRLAHYLGGEVKVTKSDSSKRATRQLERMVLSPFPVDFEAALSNNDMTKVEVIKYGKDYAKVYWRVRYSNNNSTETDVGSVEFRAFDADSTLITFHSAHRLNAPGGIHIPNKLLTIALEMTFSDFVRHYASIVQ